MIFLLAGFQSDSKAQRLRREQLNAPIVRCKIRSIRIVGTDREKTKELFMKSRLSVSGMILVCLCGCSMTRSDGTIPTGTWEGRGVYTGRDMATDEQSDATTQTAKKPGHSGEYEVKLSIQPVGGNNGNQIELKVFSNH